MVGLINTSPRPWGRQVDDPFVGRKAGKGEDIGYEDFQDFGRGGRGAGVGRVL